jgi:hypothetical protein
MSEVTTTSTEATTQPDALTKWKSTGKYVQFSKRMVACVSIGFGLMSALGMWLCYRGGYLIGVVSVVTIDGIYAILAFVAYSGNSMLEKWLIKHEGGTLGSELQGAFTSVSVTK